MTAEHTSQQWNELIEEAIKRRHKFAEHWFTFLELRVGTGYGKSSEQRIDAFCMHAWPSSGLQRVAYEIKVSRSDFLSEIKKPHKRRAAMRYSNQFYFITPPGITKPEEIPYDCGLFEVDRDGILHLKTPAPTRDSHPPSWLFLASIMRRISSNEFHNEKDKELRQAQRQLDKAILALQMYATREVRAQVDGDPAAPAVMFINGLAQRTLDSIKGEK